MVFADGLEIKFLSPFDDLKFEIGPLEAEKIEWSNLVNINPKKSLPGYIFSLNQSHWAGSAIEQIAILKIR